MSHPELNISQTCLKILIFLVEKGNEMESLFEQAVL